MRPRTSTKEHRVGGAMTMFAKSDQTWDPTLAFKLTDEVWFDATDLDGGRPIKKTVFVQGSAPVDQITTFQYRDDGTLAAANVELIGQRNLSAGDQQLFGSHTEKFVWDVGGNMKGYLRRWHSYRPGSNVPTITRQTRVNDQGLGTLTEHTFNDLAGFTGERRVHHKHNLAGLLTTTRYHDGAGSGQESKSTIVYDERGLPKHIDFDDGSGQPDQKIGKQDRNVAGLVTRRRTDTTGPMTFVRSKWSYDKLGRVEKQIVDKGPDLFELARQDLTYFGNDDPRVLKHAIGASSKRFVFGYDRRHQLLSSNETTTPGYFSSTYQYGPAGRLTNANLAQTAPAFGSELKPRNVDYQYGDPDPERVTALVDVATQQPFASYQYDEGGNQITRCSGSTLPACSGESIDLVYDGKDQLRRVTKKLAGVMQSSEEYWYDGSGARVAVVKRDANGSKSETVWFIKDVEAHYDETNSLTFVYSHLSLGTPLARINRTGGGYELEYQFHGLANHTLAAVSSIGTTNAAFSYTPFGEVLEAIDAGGY